MFSKNNNSQTVWIGLSFLAVGLMLGLLFANGGLGLANLLDASGTGDEGKTPPPQVDVDTLETVTVSADDDAILGDVNAPITIVEFSDFECPYCRSFVNETLPLLMENYIDTGKVKLVYRDFPLPSHEQADDAAQAAECVRASEGTPNDELYYQMHDILFLNSAKWAGQADVKPILIDLAMSEMNVDIATCLNNDEMLDEINQDYTAGKSYGISGTPTFFINGKKLVGAWPYEVFESVIESQL